MFTINKFHAHNYRGIEHIDVDFQPGVNLIIGENGSGKTSLVSAINSWLSETRGLIGIGGGGIDKKDAYRSCIRYFDKLKKKNRFTPQQLLNMAEDLLRQDTYEQFVGVKVYFLRKMAKSLSYTHK